MALCWLFGKRAFSVSGKFRQLLTDLIKTKHNSNQKAQQITLTGEIVPEYSYYCLGIVPREVIRLKRDVAFSMLGKEQIIAVEEYLESRKMK